MFELNSEKITYTPSNVDGPVLVGVLADTHLPYRLDALPSRTLDLLADRDVILHAGDVDRREYLAPLLDFAPVYAVSGNVHLGDWSDGGRDLPVAIQLEVAGRQVVMTHGHRRGLSGLLLKIPSLAMTIFSMQGSMALNRQIETRLQRQYPDADMIIFGHTHAPMISKRGKTVFVNPGAVASTPTKWSSLALLAVWSHQVSVQIVPLTPGQLDKKNTQRLAGGGVYRFNE